MTGSPLSTRGLPYRSALRARSSSISSGSRVSITCLRKPISGIGCASRRSPRSITYGKLSEPARLVVDGDVDDLRVEDLLELVADEVVDRLRIELAGDRGLDAVDQRQLGVRCRVSCTSRAFSSATLRLPASVVSRRTSDSPRTRSFGRCSGAR